MLQVDMPRFWIAKRRFTDWEQVAHQLGSIAWNNPNDAQPGDAFLAVESARTGYHDKEVVGVGLVREVEPHRWVVDLGLVARLKPPVLALLPPPVGYGRQVVGISKSLYDRLVKEVHRNLTLVS